MIEFQSAYAPLIESLSKKQGILGTQTPSTPQPTGLPPAPSIDTTINSTQKFITEPSGKSYEAPTKDGKWSFWGNLGTETVDYGGSTNFEKFHPGVDIGNKRGTPIPSFTGGVVTEIVTDKKKGDKGYGNYVIVQDEKGAKHRYSHLYKTNVKIGDKVSKGYSIGEMGNTGSTYSNSGGDGTHLDYRIQDAYKKYVNPYKYLQQYYGSIGKTINS